MGNQSGFFVYNQSEGERKIKLFSLLNIVAFLCKFIVAIGILLIKEWLIERSTINTIASNSSSREIFFVFYKIINNFIVKFIF